MRATALRVRLVHAWATSAALAITTPAWALDPPLVWRPATASPRAISAPSNLAAMYAVCGAPDAALAEVAARGARHQLEAGALLGSEELAFALRAAGDPHPFPRAIGVTGTSLDEAGVITTLATWTQASRPLGLRRCGVARAVGADGKEVVNALSVDALADLTPLPTSARVGQWLRLEGVMLVPATEAKVVLLGPRGAPKIVVASLSQGRVRSTFSVDAPGSWLVQVLATISTGPQPVLEAFVHAGALPPAQFTPHAAPGESAAAGARDDRDAILRMVNAARVAEGVSPLRRSADLDRVAQEHAVAMQRARLVGHDVGSGDVTTRVRAAGVASGRVLGENVASAQSVERAHRALWASPSHRTNTLFGGYTDAGIGVARDANGTAWVAEVFRAR